MGILDLFGGGSEQKAADPSMAALRDLGMPQSLIDAYQKENETARRMQAMQMIVGGLSNAVSGYQGMAPVAAPSIGASGGPGGAGGGGMDGIIDRALKFSKLQEGVRAQQSTAQMRQAVMADPRLSPQERNYYANNLEAYGNLISKDVDRRLSPDNIELIMDADKRIIGALDKKTGRMLDDAEMAQRNIKTASGLSQSKTWEMEDALRKEYASAPETKRYIEAEPIFRSMTQSAKIDTGAADLDLVYGIGKIMDPGSVVREGEMVMVNRASPVAEMLQGYINSISGQGKLTPETRSRLLQMARTRMGELRASHDEIATTVKSLAKERGIKEDRVITRNYGPLPDAPIFSPQINNFIPDQAINDLRSNPTEEEKRMFDGAFGPGSARRALGGQ
jgi:hypothetical protein